MIRIAFLSAVLVTLLPTSLSQGADDPSQKGIDQVRAEHLAPEPKWVEDVEPVAPEATQFSAHKGKVRLLVDRQKYVDGIETGAYTRRVEQLLSPRAVRNSGSLKLRYDPTYQTVLVHKFDIIRASETINGLENAYFEDLRDEKRLSRNIFEGRRSLYIRVEDLRPGDIIDYAYTYVGENPAAKGQFSNWYTTTFDHPVERFHLRLEWPAEMNVSIRHDQDEVTPIRDGDRLVYQFGPVATKRKRNELGAPRGYSAQKIAQISSFGSWKDVNNLVRPYFEQPADDVAFTALVQQIKEQHDSFDDRMTAAMRFVQDEIRYQAITLGLGGWIPNDPSLILERRFGDCKDKSLLLVRFARAFGADVAHVALVHTRQGSNLPNLLPSMFRFNHAIAYIEKDGAQYWIDGTMSLTGGTLRSYSHPNYKYALILAPEQASLVAMPLPSPDKPTMVLATEYDASRGSEYGVRVKGKIRMRSFMADGARTLFLSNGKEYLAERIQSGLEKEFGEIDDVAISELYDDRNQNEIGYEWSTELLDPFELPFETLDDDLEFSYELSTPFSIASLWSKRNRTLPLDIAEGINFEIVRQTVLPPNTPIELGASVKAPVEIRGEAFDYDRSVFVEDNVVTSEIRVQTKVDYVPAESARSVFREIREMDRVGQITLRIPATDSELKPSP